MFRLFALGLACTVIGACQPDQSISLPTDEACDVYRARINHTDLRSVSIKPYTMDLATGFIISEDLKLKGPDIKTFQDAELSDGIVRLRDTTLELDIQPFMKDMLRPQQNFSDCFDYRQNKPWNGTDEEFYDYSVQRENETGVVELLHAFSPIAFSPTRKSAVFYETRYCGGYCEGYYVLMEKVTGVWRIRAIHTVWAT